MHRGEPGHQHDRDQLRRSARDHRLEIRARAQRIDRDRRGEADQQRAPAREVANRRVKQLGQVAVFAAAARDEASDLGVGVGAGHREDRSDDPGEHQRARRQRLGHEPEREEDAASHHVRNHQTNTGPQAKKFTGLDVGHGAAL